MAPHSNSKFFSSRIRSSAGPFDDVIGRIEEVLFAASSPAMPHTATAEVRQATPRRLVVDDQAAGPGEKVKVAIEARHSAVHQETLARLKRPAPLSVGKNAKRGWPQEKPLTLAMRNADSPLSDSPRNRIDFKPPTLARSIAGRHSSMERRFSPVPSRK